MKIRKLLTAVALATFTISGCFAQTRRIKPAKDGFLEGEWFVTDTYYSAGEYKRAPSNDWHSYATVTFDVLKKSYVTYDGCNHGNGTYEFNGKELIYNNDGFMTQMACPCDYTTGSDGKVTRLEEYGAEVLKLQNGNYVTVLRKPGKWFLNGFWDLYKVGDKQFEDEPLEVEFDIDSNLLIINDNGVKSGVAFLAPDNHRITIDSTSLKAKHKVGRLPLLMLVDALGEVAGYRLSRGFCSVQIVLTDSRGNDLITLNRPTN